MQLGNKSDLEQALSIEQLIKEMRLEKITNRPVSVRATWSHKAIKSGAGLEARD